MASRDQQRGKLTILAATILLLGTGIFTGAAYSWGLPAWYRALFLGVAAVMVLCAVVLVLRALSLERQIREVEKALADWRARVEGRAAKPEPAELVAHPIAGRRADER